MATNFIPATCPSCNGSLQVPGSLSTVSCMYCGVTVVVPRPTKQNSEPDLQNMSAIADQAFESGNYEEAYNFYTRVLEYDIANIHAQIQRSLAAGWQSTLANFRITETKVGLEAAFKIILENDSLSDYRIDVDTAIISVSGLSIALLNLAFNHFQQFGVDVEYGAMDTLKKDTIAEAEWHDQATQVISMILYAVELGDTMEVSDEAKRVLYRSFFLGCDTVLNELTLGHPDFAVQKVFSKFPPDIKDQVSEVLDEIYPKALKLDSSIRDPRQVAEENKSNCYIATEVFDDASNSNVNILREFRYSVLRKSFYGRHFISWYYKNGKNLSYWIGCNPVSKYSVKVFLILSVKVMAKWMQTHTRR